MSSRLPRFAIGLSLGRTRRAVRCSVRLYLLHPVAYGWSLPMVSQTDKQVPPFHGGNRGPCLPDGGWPRASPRRRGRRAPDNQLGGKLDMVGIKCLAGGQP